MRHTDFSLPNKMPFLSRILWVLMVSLFICRNIYAQKVTPTTDSLKVNNRYKNSVLVAPLVSNTPETGWAFALAGVYIFKTNKKDTLLRSSTVPLGVAYTTRNQILVAMAGSIYFPKEDYILRLENTYSRFPDKFWGIGNGTFNRDYQNYSFEQVYFNPQFSRKVIGKFYMGLGFEYQQVIHLDYEKDSYFESDNVRGNSPYKSAGIGLLFRYDNRNHAYVPNKGALINFEFYSAQQWNGSDFSFIAAKFEIKKFRKIFNNHVIGLHFKNVFTFGDVPYLSMAVLGGNDIMRGYYAGRFRDKMVSAAQVEYRFPIWWRFGGVAFAGLGEVANRFTDYSFDKLKYSVGTGIRFALLPKQKLNFRFDVGWGNHNSFNYYVIVAESF
ncbi:MAG: BamA/TamA family outer membrane protein [Cytophagales bacterium]